MAVDLQALAWRIQRVFLHHGAFAWVTLAVCVIVCAQVFVLLRTHAQLTAAQGNDAGIVQAVQRSMRADGQGPVLPALSERFRITDAALERLLPDGAAPTALKFDYQQRPEAGLTRQTITFSTQARWDAVAPLLDGLQEVDRSVYIARLQLRRPDSAASTLEAQVQLSTVYQDTVAGQGAEGAP